MKDIAAVFAYDLGDLDRSVWMERVEQTAEEFGHAEPVGPDHMALFIDAGRTLLVGFETIASVRKHNDDDAPLGWGFVQSHGWSSLTLMANTQPDWFRHPAMFGYFDRMIDDGFFDDFDQVLFYGAGAAGYAAAAYSVAAPDAQVLVIQPQATLDPGLARWDRRHLNARSMDFTTRFGYAPMMVETADKVTIVHDPSVVEDAMHASLFKGGNITHLDCPYLGPNAHHALVAMDVMPDMIEQAMDATLTPASFATLWRARQTYLPYLRTLFHRLDGQDHHERLLARLCRYVGANSKRPMFTNMLEQLEAKGVILEPLQR
ncbi:hypothetical protein OAN307_c21510 [Octadecabacter antarcticus 307]|uniref:Phosphoadenosine phosphosulfate reductase n=1 Tax=Octadecabacter antarcticus 307 TaxID=391626 RepID=M9R7P2_9RHOB|nr:hypothetical protein [Octadecabacter antarcticus]AGI67783.1 hypothetical protein OAN307_c21510 [Octadecabacter antarcticus 307]